MLDLFSGIGGFALAAQRVWGDELEIHAFCEKDLYCQRVLKKHWPDVPIFADVRDVRSFMEDIENGKDVTNTEGNRLEKRGLAQQEQAGQFDWCCQVSESCRIDLITGGFPCQPFSQAGKRDGRSDDRHLWPEMLRVIRAFKPRWVVAENVRGILSIEDGLVFEQVCTDLEDSGYDVQPFVIPAVAVDAHHRRDRVWFCARYVGDSERTEWWEDNEARGHTGERADGQGQAASGAGEDEGQDAGIGGGEPGHCCRWLPEPDVGRVAHGIPCRVDRLRALGNAIVPQVAEQIFKSIKETENGHR